jgi:hypothetical protein
MSFLGKISGRAGLSTSTIWGSVMAVELRKRARQIEVCSKCV